MTSRRAFRIVIAALLLLALAFIFRLRREATPTRASGTGSETPAKPSQQVAPTPSTQTVPTATTVTASGAGTHRELPNIDRRVVPAGESPNRAALEGARQQRVQAADRLKASLPGARVDFDETLGTPKYIGSTSGFLASLPASRAGMVSGEEAQQLVKTFIDQQAPLFGHTSSVFTGTRLVRDYETPHNGMRTMVWQQELEGIRVFESTMQANVSKSGQLINISSRLVPDPAAAVENRAAILANPAVSAKTAISAAAAGIGEAVPPTQIIENAPPAGAAQKQEFRAARLLEVSSQFVWVPLDEATLRLSWEVLLTSKQRGEMYRTLIDATTGETIVRQRLTEYISPASYRVFTGDSPTPMSPGPATPGTAQPPEVARTLVTLEALDTTASPNGWINDGINETLGNNVDAHLDLNADNIADTPRPQGSPNRVFDFALDLTQAPNTYGNAAVTNLFYWNNFIHDRFYQLGFTEAAGNFQTNNFGRGGLGNDAVQADAQDGSGTNNANFSTPPDGSPGRMQMYVFTGPAPDRDGDFDQEIVIHEYTHGLSNRLVGGGVGISSLQPRGMGEGWSDFYALCLLSAPADDPNGVYASGAYASYQFGGLTQNYYYGIRRYPYCTDLTKNPLTFRDIDSAQASAHTGIPRSPIVGNTATEVHNMGEVWCVTLWDARANLIAKHGAAAGNELILQLVTDGMKLAPANPTFLQARDGIIQADLINNGGANRGELWLAFAKRGMGSAATSPVSSTTTGLVENYDVPDDLGVGPTAAWSVTATVGGPFTATQTYTLVNSGTTPLDWTTAKTQLWLALSSAGGTLAPGATTTVTASLTAAANSLVAGNYADTITFTNTTSGFAQSRAVALAVESLTVPILSETWESGTAGSAWSITGTNAHRTLVTTANAPHSGSYHLTMDSSVDGTLSRNEATWTANLAGRSNVQLRFWVKMFNDEANGPPSSPFVGGADFDGVAVSADGTNWYEVQPLRTLISTWTRYTVDLDAAIAARGLSYNSTFRIRFNHYDDYGISTDGFAFDDIELVELVNNRLSVTLPANANEGGGAVTGTVTVVPTPSSDLTITLASSQSAQASVPSSVVVAAGQASATFPVTVVDDALLDGTQVVIITATSPTHVNGSATLAVEDNESATLTLSLPTTVGEAAGTVLGTLTISTAPGTDVPVTLASSNPSEIAPITVTIPAGQTSVNFDLPVIDDTRLDGSVVTTITAAVANWTPSIVNITVTDNESAALIVSLPATAREGNGTASGAVQISGTLLAPLTIALASSDTSELTVPASVVIPAGQTSVSFTTVIVDDADADGVQSATITASAAGFADGTDTISIQDNDAHHFALSAVVGSQVPNAPFAITVSARDVNDAPITNFNSSVALAAAGDSGTLAVSPATISGWVNGIWTGNIMVTAADTNVVLTVTDGQGHTGTSNAFNVAVGPLHHFAWAPISSSQMRDNFFPVTIIAQDAGNNTVTAFSGTTNLAVAQTGGVQILSWTGYADTSLGGEYQNTKQAISTYFPSYTETNTTVTDPAQLAAALAGKHVFLIPEQESVAAGTMGALGTAWASALTSFVNSGGIVIVCSWSNDEHQLLVNSGLMTVTKGAAPSSASVTKTADTVLNAGVATPFAGSYISEYSGSNGAVSLHTTAGNPVVLSRTVGGGQAILIGTDLYTLGTGMDRIVANAVAQANATGAIIPILPAISGGFANGVWSGNVAVPFAGSSVKLRADDGAGHTGDSNAFIVQAPTPPPGPSGPIFSEPFEDATLGSWWTITGTGPYRTLLTTANTPHGGSKHLTMDSSTDGTYARNEATLSVNLAGRSGVALSFWAKGFGDEANGPPPSPFTGGYDFDGVAISADGVSWYEVQALRTLSSAYGQFTVDLDAAITTRGLSYNSSFKVRFNQYDNFAISTDGIAIDDILITGAQTPNVTLSVPAQVAENDGAITGTVSFGSARATDTSVALLSNANARVAVPASVTVLAGQTSATFTLTVLDNTLLDGSRTVSITATPPDNIPAAASIVVVDDEITSLTFNAPASATEGDAALTGTVTLGAIPSGPITLAVTSSDASEITVPATVSFAAGQTSATFPITIVDDSLIDGSQTATITIGASGWTDATASITVADNENSTLAINLAASTSENAGSLAGSVTISGMLPTDLVVSLSSSDTSEITVPATVTIPAGQASVAFLASIVDDVDPDGTQTATITVSALGFTGANQTVTVTDNDAHHFDIAAVPSPQLSGSAFSLTVTAKDINGITVSTFGAMTTLSAVADGSPVAVTPGNLIGFVNGVWTGPVSINQLASGIVLTATAGAATGSSNTFTVMASDYDDPNNWSTFGNGPAHTGYQPVTLGAAVYQAAWTKSFPPSTNGWTGLNQVAVSNGQVFVTPLIYFDSTYLSALNAATGVELWRKSFVGSYSINPPTVNAGKVYVQKGKSTSPGNDAQLWCIGAASGASVWMAPFGAQWERYFAPLVVGDGVWMDGGTYGGLYGFNTNNGSQRFFNSSLAQYDQWTPAYDNGTIYTWVAGVFRAHDPMTGTILWSSTLSTGTPYSANTVPAIATGRAFVIGNPNLFAIDLTTHATAWTVSGTFKGSPAVANGTVFALSGGDVKAYDSQTGALLGTYSTGNTAIAGQPIITNDTLIVAAPANTYIFNLATFTLRQTLPSGGVASLANGVLYVAGTDNVLRTFRPTGQNAISLSLPVASATEGSPALTGTVSLAQPPASDTLVTLKNGGSNRVNLPASVTIPAGQTSATFLLTVIDDTLLNGSEVVPVTASGPSHLFLKGLASLTVHDNETAAIALSVPASTAEGAASVTGTVILSAAPAANITVNLASSDTTEATVPESVTVPAGQTTATFTVTPIDDTEIDGTQTATITASVTGWTGGSGSIAVADNENRNFTLYGPYSVSEGQTSSGTVYISGTLSTPLTVSLTSSNPAQYSVPASVTIPAGQTSASFLGTAVEDTATDGTQTVTITASAATFVSTSVAPSAYDNDVHHFAFSSAIAGTQIANKAFNATLEARDINDVRINVYNGTLNLTGASPGGAVTIAPATVTLSSGYWNGNLTITSPGTGVTITATSGAITGVSSSFDVGLGTLDHLTWSAIGSSQTVGLPFNATVTAKDAYENTLPSVSGTAALSAGAPSRVTGSETGQYGFLFSTSTQQRDQAIYLPTEVGPAGRISSLAIQANVYSGTGGTLSNFTVRMKHTPLAGYGASPVWESTGWTTVYQGNLTVAGSGTIWVNVPLSTPFQYDGTSNLMVDFTHNGSASVYANSVSTSKSGTRTLWFSGSGYADPLSWPATAGPTPSNSPGLPNLRLGFEGTTPVVPASITLANGVWTGPVAVNQVAANIVLKATMASVTVGESNVFGVIGAPVLQVTPPGGLSAAGNFGGPVTPSTTTYTLTNTGNAPLNWAVAKTAPWLNLSTTSGTLAVGASTSVTATIAAASIEPGNYTDTLTFTNLSSGLGNTTRAVGLSIALATPTLVGEPPITGGTDNTVSWNAVAGADYYEVQAATNEAFTSALSSGPIVGTSYTFTGLSDGQTYHFRVRAKRLIAGSTGSWSQTSQADFATGTANNVSTSASPGAIVLTSATTWTENFDEAGTSFSSTIFPDVVSGWNRSSLITSTYPSTSPALPINQGGDLEATGLGGAFMANLPENRFLDGTIEGYLFPTQVNTFVALQLRGQRTPTLQAYAAGVRRDSETTGTVQIWVWGFSNVFATSPSFPINGSNEIFRLRFVASGSTLTVSLWRVAVVAGTVTETPVILEGGTNSITRTGAAQVSGVAGIYAIMGGTDLPACDDVTVTAGATGYASAGTFITGSISPVTLHRWGTLSLNKDTATGTALTVDVLDASEGLLAADVTSGADLHAVPAIASQPSIRLRANLSTTNPANTPRLDDWSISWQAAPDTLATSAWSNVVTSTQDAAFADLDGDGLPDAWETLHGLDTADDTGLHGALGDFDSDGLPNIFEYLANLDPGVSDAASAYWTTVETKPEDGLQYLVFHHRQRTGLFNWTVSLETSTNATTWDGTASLYEEASLPTLLPDGFTRIHHHRVLHPVEGTGGGRAFVRLRATAQ